MMGLISAQELVGSICAHVDRISGGMSRPRILLGEWLCEPLDTLLEMVPGDHYFLPYPMTVPEWVVYWQTQGSTIGGVKFARPHSGLAHS